MNGLPKMLKWVDASVFMACPYCHEEQIQGSHRAHLGADFYDVLFHCPSCNKIWVESYIFPGESVN